MVSVRWPGWSALLAVLLAAPTLAQERPPPKVEFGENYPNPFFPSTTIPFTLHPQLCERGHQPLVSLKIYNVLVQMVGIPILLNSNGERLENLRLRCGTHEAFWDGRARSGSRELSPGVYYAQLTVDGERFTLKMLARE